MRDTTVVQWIREKYESLSATLNERVRRLWGATEALALGWGGVSTVAEATGMSRVTIYAGIEELRRARSKPKSVLPADRMRRAGGGRKPLTVTQPRLMEALEALVEPTARGDPMSPLRWTCQSTQQLSKTLRNQKFPVSERTVAALLKKAQYSLQGNRKTREGLSHPDRNAQFEYINAQVRRFQTRGQPVVSVDAKKRESVGDFKNAGREWRPRGQPEEVRVYDFVDKKLGKAFPYGVYDLTHNEGWVSVGISHDTSRFAVESLRRWWQKMGRKRYPQARELLITADGGGSNDSRRGLWKVALQALANDLGMRLTVCHFPPGTSKWNKIEHRMFCHITANWRGRPLVSHVVIVNLIAHTRTKTGLVVRAALDCTMYPTKEKVTQEQLKLVRLTRATFHGEWNYTISPE